MLFPFTFISSQHPLHSFILQFVCFDWWYSFTCIKPWVSILLYPILSSVSAFQCGHDLIWEQDEYCMCQCISKWPWQPPWPLFATPARAAATLSSKHQSGVLTTIQILCGHTWWSNKVNENLHYEALNWFNYSVGADCFNESVQSYCPLPMFSNFPLERHQK